MKACQTAICKRYYGSGVKLNNAVSVYRVLFNNKITSQAIVLKRETILIKL